MMIEENKEDSVDLNTYVKSDISHVIFKTVMHFINNNKEEKKYTVENLQNLLSLVDMTSFHFLNEHKKHNNSLAYPGDVSSTEMFRIIEAIYDVRNEIEVEDYTVFISSLAHPEIVMKWDKNFDHFNKNEYANLLTKIIAQNNKEKLVNFIKIIAEIYYDYEYEIPTRKEWAKIIDDPENNLGGSAHLMFAVLMDNHKNKEREVICEIERNFKNGGFNL